MTHSLGTTEITSLFSNCMPFFQIPFVGMIVLLIEGGRGMITYPH